MNVLPRKRARSDPDALRPGASEGQRSSAKRPRLAHPDSFSALSDELLVRVLRHLSVSQLVTCQRVSRRFYRLGGDSQLWKAAYYARWVRPRALRLPGSRSAAALDATSKTAVWMNDQHLVTAGLATNWLRQYKLRHNWSRGDCQVREVRIAERKPTPRTLIQVHENTALTAGRGQGLRSWSIEGTTAELECAFAWDGDLGPEVAPSAMAVSAAPSEAMGFLATVGFSRGTFSLYGIGQGGATITSLVSHELPEDTGISAMAASYPFVAILTVANVLFIYDYGEEGISKQSAQKPRLMATLRSGSIWPPASLALRVGHEIHVSVAYALPQYLSGWSVGLQEVQMDRKGCLKRTRTATAADQAFTALPSANASSNASATAPSQESGSEPQSRPTALSLSHPYVLTAHSDNTLTLYMVRTTNSALEIGRGRKLWGHTSSISAVHVGSRGKAVSVGVHGNEIRVWDLEGGVKHALPPDRSERASVQVRATAVSAAPRVGTSDFADGWSVADAAGLSQDAWVGFDDQRLLVLREVPGGSEALVIHDFS